MCLDATTLPEEWRAVVGYEGVYEVSSLGRVKRVLRSKNSLPDFMKSPRLNPQTGYLLVDLKAHGVKKTLPVHKLVAEAFLSPRPDGHGVNHLDGNKHHNVAGNLEWAATSENTRHAFRLGLIKRQRMTLELIEQIRALQGTATYAEIGRRFGFSDTTIWRVMHGRTCLTD